MSSTKPEHRYGRDKTIYLYPDPLSQPYHIKHSLPPLITNNLKLYLFIKQ